MIELVQFPWSPYCIVQRRILEYAGTRFKVVNGEITEIESICSSSEFCGSTA